MNKQNIIAIFLFLTLIFGISQVWPRYQELKFLEQRNEQKRAEIRGREEYLQELKKAEETLKDYETQISKIDSVLPSEPGLEILFNFLQKASSQSGLVLTDIKPSGPQAAPNLEGLKETAVSLAVSGSYSSLKNFISVLEKTARLIEVESISFSSIEKEGPQKFDLRIKVYSY